jgi:hypothetical protein
MAYRDNVQALCDARCIRNPIDEEDLNIASLRFTSNCDNGPPNKVLVATDMNRGARLFLESLVRVGDRRPSMKTSRSLDLSIVKIFAPTFFAELWNDVGTGKRELIDAINAYHFAEIIWKDDV